MKKTVTVKTYRTETLEVEVEFPIYRYQDVAPDMGYPDEHFERTEADGTTWSIHRSDRRRYDKDTDGVGTSYEVQIEKTELGGEDIDYALGRGSFRQSS